MLALSIIAICLSGLALGVATLAMLATRRNAAVAVRKELRELADRDDAEGPEFTAEPAEVENWKAKIKIRVVGGPGAVAVSVRPGIEWCRGVSSGEREAVDEVWFPPCEPGDVLTVTVHLKVNPWQGHTDGVALPLLIDAQSREDRRRRWERRIWGAAHAGPAAHIGADTARGSVPERVLSYYPSRRRCRPPRRRPANGTCRP